MTLSPCHSSPILQARRYGRQLVHALKHLHENEIVHRDLKMENLMLSFRGEIKIIDFGLSNDLTGKEHLLTHCGSMSYSAPELLCRKPYGKEVDIWSLGVCLYVMLVGKLPFPTEGSLTEQHALMLDGRYVLPESLTPELKDLFDRIFQVKPSKRISLDEILEHEWFSSHPEAPTALEVQIESDDATVVVDRRIVQQMINMGFDSDTRIIESVTEHKCDSTYATYHLLLQRRQRLALAAHKATLDSGYHDNETPANKPTPPAEGRERASSISRRNSYKRRSSVEERRGSVDESSTGRRQSLSKAIRPEPPTSEPPARRPSTSRVRRSSESDETSGGNNRRGSTSRLRRMTSVPNSLLLTRRSDDGLSPFEKHAAKIIMSIESRDVPFSKQGCARLCRQALLHAEDTNFITLLRQHKWNGLEFVGDVDFPLFASQLRSFLPDRSSPTKSPQGSQSDLRRSSSGSLHRADSSTTSLHRIDTNTSLHRLSMSPPDSPLPDDVCGTGARGRAGAATFSNKLTNKKKLTNKLLAPGFISLTRPHGDAPCHCAPPLAGLVVIA
eukprot:m.63207 g.63207  ORF g.63207 m.63207 type:complete len:557 (-) comp7443_c0_seq3:515-2185(-)